jgi:hypothetical protein
VFEGSNGEVLKTKNLQEKIKPNLRSKLNDLVCINILNWTLIIAWLCCWRLDVDFEAVPSPPQDH